MQRATFPARREDGSFCIEMVIEFSGSPKPELEGRIQNWIRNQWMPQNQTWVWESSSGRGITGIPEVLHYSDEFTGPPELKIVSDSKLLVRLRGSRTAKFWRDWLVLRLIEELKAEFTEIELGRPLYSRNCLDKSMT